MSKAPKKLPQPIQSYSEAVFNDISTAAAVLWAQSESPTGNPQDLQRLVSFGCRRLYALGRLIEYRMRRDANDPLPDERAMNRFDQMVCIFLTAVEKVEVLLQPRALGEFETYDVLLSEFISDANLN